ncbi:putative LysM domain protein [Aspergillus stella-maris]|uniref:putative LysM domain protein n=1 Tax=Aspergillus stella-maris TaxID=1810926 RepID=UPI003CCDF786
MIAIQGLTLAFAVLASSSATILSKRWTNGDSPTGDTDPGVTTGCSYWANSIAEGDTCADLLQYFGITTAQLVAWNPSLSQSDCELEVGLSYCVEAPNVSPPTTTTSTTTTGATSTTKTTTVTTTTGGPSPTQTGLTSECNDFYLVEKGDYCQAIVDLYGSFTLEQFYAWNPAVKNDCSGLQAGYYICVGVSGSITTTKTTLTTTTSAPPSTTTAPHSPQQSGIAEHCNDYYFVVSGDTCIAIASGNGISLADFYAWNPAVGSSCAGLQAGYYVCVGVSGASTTTKTASTTTTATSSGPSPTQSGIASDCTTFYQAKSGDSCWTITSEEYTYLTQDLFYQWNPAVGSTCSNLQTGYYYCVATSDVAPMPDTISTCAQWHQVASGDTCWDIQQQYGITAAQFGRWNPYVGSGCASLWLGYFVCVGV